MKLPRWRLFPKYATLIIAVVGGVLVASGAVSLVFSWREIQAHLVALQVEKAQGAATRIEQYVLDIEHQMGWTAFPRTDTAADANEQRRIEYLKLLKQAPAITELVWIGPDGRERLRVSRLAMDAVGAGTDLSHEPAFVAAKSAHTWFGPVQFRKGTEPYMAIARPAGGDGGVTVADVNLKFVWDVVSRIKIGDRGLAYVVDANGTLIAHPDISLVLKKTDLRVLPQVAALAKSGQSADVGARNLAGEEVFAADAPIPALHWTVLVETPRAEAFAPLYESMIRLGLLLVGALLVATAASFFLARALVRPIRALQEGAARIGAGELDQRIEVKTGDELEGLAAQFNQMGSALQASYASLERKVDERTRELTEALAYQTAISEVLRVISQSPTDVAPVFEAIMDSAQRLFGTSIAAVFRFDGRQIHLIGTRGWSEAALADARRLYPGPPNPEMMTGRVVLTGRAQTIVDTHLDPQYDQTTARVGQWRRMIGAPMLKDGAALGVIVVAWPEPGETPQRQRDLLQTFTSQAVIAIENARLFNETKEALEQQTATAEVLQVISGSVADAQPVFEKILRSCQTLFAGDELGAVLAGDDGQLQLAAALGPGGVPRERRFVRPVAGSATELALRERRVLNYVDTGSADMPDTLRQMCEQLQIRSLLMAPMLWENRGVGSIWVGRASPLAFGDREERLLRTFADQAVIAIQNSRLFNETKEALEQQTATAEVLGVISSSVADTAPVFEKILHSCSHLFESSEQGVVLLGDDGRLHLGAHRGSALERLDAIFPMAMGDEPVARAMAEQRVLHYPDVLRDAEPGSVSRRVAERLGVGSYTQVFAPMRWEGGGAGYLYVIRSPVTPFSDKEIGLLKTFADQAAIAIQNAKLFHEIEDKSRQLEAANRHKSEFLANMSHELRTPLNAIIGFSEVLAEQMFGEVNDKQMEYLKDIHSSGQHLLMLINDVLDLSKIEAGKMELDLSCFDLGLLLEHSATLVRERALRHGLTLELDVGDGLVEWVADARKVKQVVVNLLSNAVKFTPNGGRVTVRARHLNGVDGHEGSWAQVSVIDTGVGIAPQDQALVFEEFRQASGDVLRKSEGTGLGLALVRRFVELHGGAVTLVSEPGIGSTFSFTLPQHEVRALQ
jgi:signal transduction histidine kinase